MNKSRQKGNFTGGYLIYGYKTENKKVVIDEEKAKVVREIFEKYASGVFVKDIIADLTERGIYNRGKPFARNTIYNILKNEKYAGIVRHNDEVFTNIFPRIVPDDVYRIVKQKTGENHYGKHDSTAVYLLKNKVKCGYCGKTVASETGTAKNGTIKRYYKCLGRKTGSSCQNKPIRKDLFEKLVVDTTFKIFDNLNTLDMVANKVIEINKKRIADQSTVTILIKERNEAQKQIDNLIDCMAQGIVTNSTKQRIEELERKLNELNEKIVVERTKEKIQVSREEVMKFIRTSLKKDCKQMLKSLIKEIVLYNDKIEIVYNYVDAKRIKLEDEHKPETFYTEEFETDIDEHRFKQNPKKLHFDIDAKV